MIEHVGPSFESDALEDCEHGKSKVIKVGDAVIWAIQSGQADHTNGGAVETDVARVGTRVRILHYVAWQ